jgi:hypothetical protein
LMSVVTYAHIVEFGPATERWCANTIKHAGGHVKVVSLGGGIPLCAVT